MITCFRYMKFTSSSDVGSVALLLWLLLLLMDVGAPAKL